MLMINGECCNREKQLESTHTKVVFEVTIYEVAHLHFLPI